MFSHHHSHFRTELSAPNSNLPDLQENDWQDWTKDTDSFVSSFASKHLTRTKAKQFYELHRTSTWKTFWRTNTYSWFKVYSCVKFVTDFALQDILNARHFWVCCTKTSWKGNQRSTLRSLQFLPLVIRYHSRSCCQWPQRRRHRSHWTSEADNTSTQNSSQPNEDKQYIKYSKYLYPITLYLFLAINNKKLPHLQICLYM